MNRSLLILVLTAILACYFLLAQYKSSLVEEWLLKNIWFETILIISLIYFHAFVLFKRLTTILIFISFLYISIVVILPVLLIDNTIKIFGPWDSSAHYSFAKYIIIYGHIPWQGLYYSYEYLYHPGSGLLPSILSLINFIDLALNMWIILFVAQYLYLLFIIVSIRYVLGSDLERITWSNVMLIVAFSLLILAPSPYYGGTELGHLFLPILLYSIITYLFATKINKQITLINLIAFLGLLSTHLSTATILVLGLLFSASAILVISHFHTSYFVFFKRLSYFAFIFTIIIIFYEAFADLILFSSLINPIPRILSSLFVREVYLVQRATTSGRYSYVEILQYVLSNNFKMIVLIIASTIYLIVVLSTRVWKKEDRVKYLLFVVFVASLFPLWVLLWMASGELLTIGRTRAIYTFFLILGLVQLVSRAKIGKKIQMIVIAIINFILYIIGFISAFNLPFQPLLKSGNETFVLPLWSQGGITDYALHPILYLRTYNRDTPFLCLQPYTGFGLCDMLWFSPKIPSRGFIVPEIMGSQSIISLLSPYMGKSVIVPQPLRDKLLPSPIGSLSIYEKPYVYLLYNGSGIIYNNGLYTLIVT
jgi:hypothetical protein